MLSDEELEEFRMARENDLPCGRIERAMLLDHIQSLTAELERVRVTAKIVIDAHEAYCKDLAEMITPGTYVLIDEARAALEESK